MKSILLVTLFLTQIGLYAQKPCEFAVNVTDSLGTFKETADYLVAEQNFAGRSAYIYFALAMDKEMPLLKMQMIARSKEFIAANCLDKNSRIFLQLDNGKIVTLVYRGDMTCGTNVRNDQGFNNHILTAYFAFAPNSFEDLVTSPVGLMRIKYATETKDYVFPSVLRSELHKTDFDPQRFFINMMDCLAQ